jgi:broad specificity phosphatase PhoE
MKRIIYLLLIVAIFSCDVSKKEKTDKTETTTVYYFIRHAEKDRSNLNDKDPKLTEAGEQRARKWSEIFKNVNFDHIYSTSYNRTQQTVFYTSEKKSIPIKSYDPKKLYSDSFKENTFGKTVLIVGHSNTTPYFVHTILGNDRFDLINDSNNGNLYIVTIIDDKKSVQLLTIN